jgi:hypothetical protein
MLQQMVFALERSGFSFKCTHVTDVPATRVVSGFVPDEDIASVVASPAVLVIADIDSMRCPLGVVFQVFQRWEGEVTDVARVAAS